MNAIEIGRDLLSGAAEIAEFLYGDKNRKRHVYNLADKGLPIFRMGGELCGRRSVLKSWIAEQEAAAIEKARK